MVRLWYISTFSYKFVILYPFLHMEYLDVPIKTIKEKEAIVVATLNGQIVAGNPEAVELYQYPSLRSFLQCNLRDLMPDDFNQFYPELMTPEHLNTQGYRIHVNRRMNGELFACRLHTHHQDIKGSKYLVGHVIEVKGEELDIEKIQLQQNIIVLQRELEAERNKNAQRSYQETSQLLTKTFPVLNSNDIKVCHYLILNYNTKAIADKLNITVDGVFAARKRIRKKLNIKPEADLTRVLLQAIK